ncbi:hypothetical protein ESZ53_08315 [Salinibacterium sp. UTAS2018]|uniref:hypothetical protein n=1 Tax=Salinibacterium sp. UTAS2018 TaxID=2508880 RepID=UPI0010095902|nr:hypothetical protein [Salinibacterium sp. UTAS2018]QAV70443.1 hypothetical protein ESZ53_08315 [Salinibacterium sp. UTAS2018]
MIWVALLSCVALSLGSSIAMFPAVDRWNDCGRVASELDLAAVASPLLAAAAIGAWFWLRRLIHAARPELLPLTTAAIVALLLIAVVPLQFLGAGSWDESAQTFRVACGLSEWIALARGMSLHLPAVSVIILATANPRARPLTTPRVITSIAIITALWVTYIVAASPFATSTPA